MRLERRCARAWPLSSRRWCARHICKQSELERQLLLAGETPGLILNATFAAGKEVGGSVLVLTGRYRAGLCQRLCRRCHARRVRYRAGGDNGCRERTGRPWRTVGGVRCRRPGRRFLSRNFPTRRYLSATYSMPLGIDGWKFELFATDGRTAPYATTRHGDIRRVRSGPRQGHLRSDQDSRCGAGAQLHVRTD